ncbi:Gfo/Idh/MocA family protein [Paenibacillus sp. 598K]|uniref:Gfo/Idh/MocA family protein n=1 Tax=Paenibacillus sp. 598K TaxID=1117987 RepID=UPI000FFF0AC4|nr:Gfo/Idh/MocA family oxidoreductase [Paenibacillus sp. 598K]
MQEKRELRVAVLGAGIIAGSHLEAISATPGVTACAVADLDQAKVGELAERWGIKGFTDYREMLRNELPDIAVIALPHFLHKEASLAAIAHGAHLMLEKPMALSTAECDEIISAAEQAGIRVLVGHTQHYIAENIEARRWVRSGELGPLVMIQDNRHLSYFRDTRPSWFLDKALSGGGILANLGTHSIDKIQWLSDSAVSYVSASTSRHADRGNVEGSGMIYMRLQSGVSATIVQSGYPGEVRDETELIFAGGMLKLATGRSLWVSRGGPYEPLEVPQTATPFERQYAELAAAIRDGRETDCPPAYARGIIGVLEAVYRSAETGREQEVL